MHDLIRHRRAEERRHRHPAMRDGEIVAVHPRHRTDRGILNPPGSAGSPCARPPAPRRRSTAAGCARAAQDRAPPASRRRTRIERERRVRRIPVQHQASGTIRPCLDLRRVHDAPDAGGNRRREHQKPDRRRERQMQAGIRHRIVRPSARAVDHHVGFEQPAVRRLHAGHPATVHDDFGHADTADHRAPRDRAAPSIAAIYTTGSSQPSSGK